MSRPTLLVRCGRALVLVALGTALVFGGGAPGTSGSGAAPGAAWADDAADAQAAAKARCRGQCLAYNLFWCPDLYGRTCFSLFQQHCVSSQQDAIEAFVGMAVNLAAGELIDLDAVAQAAGCYTVLKTCIQDFASACAGECDYNPLAYAPNPSVYWNSESQLGNSVSYDEAAHLLRVQVKNTGYSLARNVTYSVSIGSTTNQDRHVAGTVVESGTIPLLSPACTLVTAPGVPPKQFVVTIPFDPPANAYTEVLVSVDGNQMIEETNEHDNLFRYVFDDLPSPCQVQIQGVRVERERDVLDRATLLADLKNGGEEDCNVTVAVFAGTVEAGEAPIAERDRAFSAGGTAEVPFTVVLDVSGGSPSGSRRARFTVRVTGTDGRVHDERTVEVPLLAGRISGRVKNELDRPVVGATVTATGAPGSAPLATTPSATHGFYHLEGIAQLGQITVTASHPDYSATATRTVTLAYDPDAEDPEAGLDLPGVDLVLTNKPGTLVIVVKDKATQQPLGGATYSAVSPPKSVSGTMASDESTRTLEGLSPGEWLVSASKAGYGADTERTTLVTDQTATVVLWLEPFTPRDDDDDLVIHPPVSLWKRTFDGWVYGHTSSKDGRLLVLYTCDPGVTGSGKLHFIDAIRGTEWATVAKPSAKGEQQVALDVAYRGDPVAVFLHEFIPGRPGPGSLVLYDERGQERARLTPPPAHHPYVEVSPDGAWVHAWGLFDGMLGEVPDHRELDPRRYPRGYPQERYLVDEAIHFTREDTFIGMCPGREGPRVCRLSMKEEPLQGFPGVKPVLRIVDSGGPTGGEGARQSEVFLICTDSGFHRTVGSQITFTKTPEDFGIPHAFRFESASLSPGGDVVMIAEGVKNARMHVYSWRTAPPGPSSSAEPGRDITPAGYSDWVKHVSANEKGLFFLRVRGHEAEYFRMGRYGPLPPRPRPHPAGD